MTDMLSREQVLEAVARGWCHAGNTHKEMDTTLANAIAEEIMALRSLDAGAGMGAVPAGWKLIRAERADMVSVPMEPDDDTIERMMLCWLSFTHPYSTDFGATQEQLSRMREVYKAALAARPNEVPDFPCPDCGAGATETCKPGCPSRLP